jgi:hypothetical protein
MADEKSDNPQSTAALSEVEVKALLDHIDRCWKSECENSSRYDARTRIFVPLTATVIGFVFATLGGAFFASPFGSRISALSIVPLLFALPGIVLLFSSLIMAAAPDGGRFFSLARWSLGRLLLPVRNPWRRFANWTFSRSPRDLQQLIVRSLKEQRSRKASASRGLHFDPDIADLTLRTLPAAASLVWINTYWAAIDLCDKNEERRERLRASERWLAYGLVWIGLSVLCHLSVRLIQAS